VSTKTAVSSVEEEWVKEVLDNNSMVGMLNIQFDESITDEDLGLTCL
jgi:hypothetical protein